MPRRDVDQQVPDLPSGYGLEVLHDGIDVPAGDERRCRLSTKCSGARSTAEPRSSLSLQAEFEGDRPATAESWDTAGRTRQTRHQHRFAP